MKSNFSAQPLAMPVAIIALGILWSDRGYGQIVPDNSLGPESSLVGPAALDGIEGLQIDGGAVRGTNLFHSFSEFNVNPGTAAYFTNPGGIENILSRVTGGKISQIFGTLGVLGNANLFLLNPAGIVFGPDASLDLGGDFVGAAADSVIFGNGFEFSATNPQEPPLLTIDIPTGLNFRENPGAIVLRGSRLNAPDIFSPEIERDFEAEFFRDTGGLRVPSGKTLALVGGAIDINGGIITAPSGRIELGSVAGSGAVSLTPTDIGFDLSYEGVSSYGDMQLSGQSAVFSGGVGGGGDIEVRGRHIGVESSRIEINSLGNVPGGNIRVHATESVALGGTTEGQTSILGSRTFGEGDAGEVRIETRRLIVADGADITAETLVGRGRGGNLLLRASESVEVRGTSPNGEFPSAIGAGSAGPGDAGNVRISTRQLIIRDGAEVDVSTEAVGAGGTLKVRASELVEVRGSRGEAYSTLGAETEGPGNAGSVKIETRQLIISDGAKVGAETTGAGDAGDVTILTGQLIIENGGVAGAQTLSEGNAGTVTVRVDELVEIRGVSPDGKSSVLGAVTTGAGNAGNVTISTEGLIIRDGGGVDVSTEGVGMAGNLTVRASESVLVSGTSADGEYFSTLGAETAGTGNAGDVSISTGRLIIENGGAVEAQTLSEGKAGTVTVRADELVEVRGISPDGEPSVLAVGTTGAGNAGDITIETGRLTIRDGGAVIADTMGAGNAGNLTVRASESVEVGGTSVNRSSALGAVTLGAGSAGNITIETGQLIVSDGGIVIADTVGAGNAGNLTVRASESVEMRGRAFLGAATFNRGDAGNIAIETEQLKLQSGRIGVNGEASGNPGSISIVASFIRLDDRAFIDASSATGRGGNVDLTSRDLQLRNGSQISAAGSQIGRTTEGNININAETLVLLESSGIITSAGDPAGGSNINIAPIAGSALVVLQSQDSTINAVGELQLEGDLEVQPVQINQLELSPLEGQIVEGCEAYRGSSFTSTGRGGLPPDPHRDIITNTARVSWIEPVQSRGRSPSSTPEQKNPEGISSAEIVPAKGWIWQEDGSVRLVGYDPTGRAARTLPPAQRCRSR